MLIVKDLKFNSKAWLAYFNQTLALAQLYSYPLNIICAYFVVIMLHDL